MTKGKRNKSAWQILLAKLPPPLSHLLGIWGISDCATASHFVYIVMTENENAEMEKQHQNDTCLRQEQN